MTEIIKNVASSKIKILQLVSPTGYYGAERWIVALRNNLSKYKVECDLGIFSDDQKPPEELVSKFSSCGGKTHILPMSGSFDITVVRCLLLVVKKEGYDVLHSHGYKSDIFALLIKFVYPKISIVSTPHGFGEAHAFKLRFFHASGLFALRFFDKVLPLSPSLMRFLSEKGIARSKLKLIMNGVDLSDMPPVSVHREVGYAKELRIGYIGRLVKGKQVDHLILAFNQIWQSDTSVRLHIVGEGDQLGSLIALTDTLTCNNNVTFHGYVADRYTLLKTFGIFVLPSRSEGLPRSIMEAMALQIPVVAYDINGVNTLLEDGKTGVLCKPGNWRDLERGIKSIICDRIRARIMAGVARERVEALFSASAMAREYEDLYSEILGMKQL